MIYATRGLLQVLLERSREAEPESVGAGLSVSRAGAFQQDLGIPDDTPVFTHFYLPEAGESVTAVFGMDLATPAGQTQGRFISHPDGEPTVTVEDDLHGIVFVAVPPWRMDDVAVYARNGGRQELQVLDAEPPEEILRGEGSLR